MYACVCASCVFFMYFFTHTHTHTHTQTQGILGFRWVPTHWRRRIVRISVTKLPQHPRSPETHRLTGLTMKVCIHGWVLYSNWLVMTHSLFKRPLKDQPWSNIEKKKIRSSGGPHFYFHRPEKHALSQNQWILFTRFPLFFCSMTKEWNCMESITPTVNYSVLVVVAWTLKAPMCWAKNRVILKRMCLRSVWGCKLQQDRKVLWMCVCVYERERCTHVVLFIPINEDNLSFDCSLTLSHTHT